MPNRALKDAIAEKKAELGLTNSSTPVLSRLGQIINDFKASGELAYHFPTSLSAEERRSVHLAAEAAGLHTQSEGEDAARHVVLSKQAPVVPVDPAQEAVLPRDVSISWQSRQVDDVVEALAVIKTESGSSRIPITLTCVLDISGSMGTIAEKTAEDGTRETHGLSLLDLVQHAMKTLIGCLTERYRWF